MSVREAERLGVMRKIDQGTMSLRRASEELGLSRKQVNRIRGRYEQLGAKVLFLSEEGLGVSIRFLMKCG